MAAPNISSQDNPKLNNGLVIILTHTINPAAVTAATCAEQHFTVNGVLSTDVVLNIIKPSDEGVSVSNGRAYADNAIAMTFCNPTAGAINPSSETYTIALYRPNNPDIGTTIDGFPNPF